MKREPEEWEVEAARWFIVGFVKGWDVKTLWMELRNRGLEKSRLVPPTNYNKVPVRRLVHIQWPALAVWLFDHERSPTVLKVAPQMARLRYVEGRRESRNASVRDDEQMKLQYRQDRKRNAFATKAISDKSAHDQGRGWTVVKGVRSK